MLGSQLGVCRKHSQCVVPENAVSRPHVSAFEVEYGKGLVNGHLLRSHPGLLDHSLWESEFIPQLSGDSVPHQPRTVTQGVGRLPGPTSSSCLLSCAEKLNPPGSQLLVCTVGHAMNRCL